MLCGLSACRQGTDVDPSWATVALPGEAHVVDTPMANVGAALFRTRCAACHMLAGAGGALGPDLSGVTLRRSPAWIHAMITNPDSMLRADSTARTLYERYEMRMLDVDAEPAEVRALVEYIWWVDRSAKALPPPDGE